MKKVLFLSLLITALILCSFVCFGAEPWQGDHDILPSELVFSSNSSGLDFRDGKLYSVDNGEGSLYVMDVTRDGEISFAPGFDEGVSIAYKSRSYNSVPDAEGVSADKNGFVYIAAERDNTGSKSLNMILKVDPEKTPNQDNIIQADKDWDITSAMPSVGSNKGIEACEWVDFEDVNGKIVDKNTGELFDSANYPDSDSEGMVFAGLEANGHIYGFVLNSDSSYVLICDIYSGFDGIMALDFDEYEKVLWAVTDNNFENCASKLSFNGTDTPDMVKILAPEGIDISDNNEGFAIADHSYTVDRRRPVYHITDGPTKGALLIGSIFCDYEVHECLAFEWVTIKDPSCINGIRERRCIECGKVAETEEIPAVYDHHDNSRVVYGIRINSKGIKELYCTVCRIPIMVDATNISLIFEDVELHTWYGDAVGYIYYHGYMGSTSSSKYIFEPSKNTSRAMFVTILGRFMGIDTEKYSVEDSELPFSDMKNGQWYTPYVIWAKENGIVNGLPDGTFGLSKSITREQIVTIIYRTNKPVYTFDQDAFKGCTDSDEISGYALEAFAWAKEKGIINGTSATELSPKKNASRAQIAQLMRNYINYLY